MTCNENLFNFNTTEELENIQTGIGQDRGIKALEFGLQVNVKGYNLYIEGPSGVGKTMYTKNYLDKISKKKKFQMTGVTFIILTIQTILSQYLCLAGQGKEFRDNMDGFIKEIKKDIKKHLMLTTLKRKGIYKNKDLKKNALLF